jgi:hypothetical protein
MRRDVRNRPMGKGTRIPFILSCRGPRRAPMRAVQPVRQQAGRFIRRAAVKRHERRRHAGSAEDVGAPAILGDRRDLDSIGVSCDRFLKVMNEAWHERRRDVVVEERAFLRGSAARSSEGNHEGSSTIGQYANPGASPATKKSCCVFINRFFTEHPQVFHTARSPVAPTTVESAPKIVSNIA